MFASCKECKHSFNEASCTEPKTCSLCGVSEGEAKGHSFGEWVVTEASCTENGSRTRTCSCGVSESEVIAAAHDLRAHEAKAPTCTEIGYEAYEDCTRCDYTTYVELPLVAHDTVSHEAKASTCIEVGYGAYVTCKNCEYSTYAELPLAEHDIVIHEKVASSCTEVGYSSYETCRNCDYATIPTELPLAAHDTVSHNGKASTCIEAGCAPYVTCKNCDYSTYAALPLAAHDIVPHEGKDATCTEAGYAPYVTCNHCEYTTYKPLPVAGHSYTEITTPPTCEGEGYTTYTCKNCPESHVADRVQPHGHTWGGWFVSEEVSSQSDGEKRQNCVNCDKHNVSALEVIMSGNIGAVRVTDVKYTLFEDGTLKFSGSGKSADCSWNGATQPYVNYRDFIKRVIIGEGITEVGVASFALMPNLEYAYIPTTLTKLSQTMFMDSFKPGVTSFTIPANVTHIGVCPLGQFNKQYARFTEIIIENPNVTFAESQNNQGKPYVFVNAYADRCQDLTIYSYGSNNNVKTYADNHGLKYVDLNSMANGTIGNISYNCFEGVLTLNAIDSALPAELPDTAPWLEKISKTAITEIVINAPVSAIPDEYFKGYTALTSVSIPKSVRSIGSLAFATDAPCSYSLVVNMEDTVDSLAADFLKNRSSVTVNGFKCEALNAFSQSGVTLRLKGSLKILMIGNSLSLDAADCLSANTPSQLYNIIKSMVGDDVYVEIGVLYSGARSAGWHATVAESNAAAYTFYLISDDTNGMWKSFSGYTSSQGLLYDNWDIVTIQPYAAEVNTGVGSTTDTDTKTEPVKAEKFYPLSASLPYLLDHIDKYCEDAEVYYYLTWSGCTTPELNGNIPAYNKMLGVAKTALTYVGTESGKGFDGFIPVGTAIQNARSTYLGLQYYVTDNKAESSHFQQGLQRDNVHLSITTGRYIAALAFARLLVPEEYVLDNYTLPYIADSGLVGVLPREYTEIAQLCVQKMLDSMNATGDAYCAPTVIEGYTEEPSAVAAARVRAMDLTGLNAASEAGLLELIRSRIAAVCPEGTVITVSADGNINLSGSLSEYTVTVSIRYGYTTSTVTKTVSARLS